MDALEFTVAEDLGIGVVDLQGAEQGDTIKEQQVMLRTTGTDDGGENIIKGRCEGIGL